MTEQSRALEFAQLYVESDRPIDALRVLHPHLAVQPDDTAALCLAAAAHLALGDLDAATVEAERAVAVEPLNAPTWRLLAYVAAESGDADRAENAAERARHLDPHDAESHLTVAIVDIQTGRVRARSVEAADRAIELDPLSAMSHVIRGDVLAALKRRKAARAAYAEALRIDPFCEVANNNRWVVSMGYSSVGTAAASFIDIVASKPNSPLALLNLKVTMSKAILGVHRILWLCFLIAHFTNIPMVVAGPLGEPTTALALRWAIFALATVGLLAFTHRLRGQLGSRAARFVATARLFDAKLRRWVVSLALVYALLLVAAVVPDPWFRFAYFGCLVALCVGAIASGRIKKQLEAEKATLDSRLDASGAASIPT